MTSAVAVLTCLVAATLWCLFTRTVLAAAAVLVCSAAWLPANRYLEGRTVLVLSARHGVTVADLIGLGCWVFAAAVLVFRVAADAPPRRRGSRGMAALACCAVVLCLGALAAYASG